MGMAELSLRKKNNGFIEITDSVVEYLPLTVIKIQLFVVSKCNDWSIWQIHAQHWLYRELKKFKS